MLTGVILFRAIKVWFNLAEQGKALWRAVILSCFVILYIQIFKGILVEHKLINMGELVKLLQGSFILLQNKYFNHLIRHLDCRILLKVDPRRYRLLSSRKLVKQYLGVLMMNRLVTLMLKYLLMNQGAVFYMGCACCIVLYLVDCCLPFVKLHN